MTFSVDSTGTLGRPRLPTPDRSLTSSHLRRTAPPARHAPICVGRWAARPGAADRFRHVLTFCDDDSRPRLPDEGSAGSVRYLGRGRRSGQEMLSRRATGAFLMGCPCWKLRPHPRGWTTPAPGCRSRWAMYEGQRGAPGELRCWPRFKPGCETGCHCVRTHGFNVEDPRSTWAGALFVGVLGDRTLGNESDPQGRVSWASRARFSPLERCGPPAIIAPGR